MTTHLETDPFEEFAFVYIRHMDAGEIEEALPKNAIDDLQHPEALFAVLSSDGECLAIAEGRDAAIAAAVAHNLTPLSVH